MSDYYTIDKCLCCDGDNIKLLLDLNEQSLANSYHDNTETLEKYPLGVNLCQDCYHKFTPNGYFSNVSELS